VTVNNLAAGARQTYTVDCPSGRLAMGGGANVAPGPSNTANHSRLVLQASYPLDADTWQIAVVTSAGVSGNSQAFQVTPYVICN
jgi:hypothetical protein